MSMGSGKIIQNISEIFIFRVMSKTVLENSSNFFPISILGSWARPLYWKTHSLKKHEYLFSFFRKSGRDFGIVIPRYSQRIWSRSKEPSSKDLTSSSLQFLPGMKFLFYDYLLFHTLVKVAGNGYETSRFQTDLTIQISQ